MRQRRYRRDNPKWTMLVERDPVTGTVWVYEDKPSGKVLIWKLSEATQAEWVTDLADQMASAPETVSSHWAARLRVIVGSDRFDQALAMHRQMIEQAARQVRQAIVR